MFRAVIARNVNRLIRKNCVTRLCCCRRPYRPNTYYYCYCRCPRCCQHLICPCCPSQPYPPCQPCPPCPPCPDPCCRKPAKPKKPIPPNPCCPVLPHGNYRIYKYFFLLVCVPLIGKQMTLAFHGGHHVNTPCRHLEYMRRRTKRFPWGEGEESFFHNPDVNSLPGECTDQCQPQCDPDYYKLPVES